MLSYTIIVDFVLCYTYCETVSDYDGWTTFMFVLFKVKVYIYICHKNLKTYKYVLLIHYYSKK